MHSLQSHKILIFRPMSGILQPHSFVHGFQNSISFLLIRLRILTDDSGNASRQKISPVVIGGRMGHGTTVVLQGITCPNTAISIIKSVVIGIPSLLLPSQMTLDNRPHLAHISRICIKLEVPKQLIYINQVHVVMMKLMIFLRISADIAVTIHRSTPFVSTTSQVVLLVHEMRFGNRHISNLTLGVCIKMDTLSILHAEEIAHIGTSPAGQRHAPAHGSMLPNLAVPGTIGSHHQSSTDRIDIGIGLRIAVSVI